MSETAACRDILAKYCREPFGMDVGAGGDRIVPHAWTFDMPTPYTSVGNERQQLLGDCREFPFLADNALDWLFASHVLEDFSYPDLVDIITEWRRVLKPGGLLVINCPDQQRFLAHVARVKEEHGVDVNNLAHFEQSFSLQNFIEKVLNHTGPWEAVFTEPEAGVYSWYLTVRKVE